MNSREQRYHGEQDPKHNANIQELINKNPRYSPTTIRELYHEQRRALEKGAKTNFTSIPLFTKKNVTKELREREENDLEEQSHKA